MPCWMIGLCSLFMCCPLPRNSYSLHIHLFMSAHRLVVILFSKWTCACYSLIIWLFNCWFNFLVSFFFLNCWSHLYWSLVAENICNPFISLIVDFGHYSTAMSGALFCRPCGHAFKSPSISTFLNWSGVQS